MVKPPTTGSIDVQAALSAQAAGNAQPANVAAAGVSKKADNQIVQQPDGQLVHAVLAGRLSAFDELVARHQRRALAVAMRLLGNQDDALEVTQEAFLKAYGSLRGLGDAERFAPWLMRIVSNLSLNRRRSRALRRTASIEGPADGDGQQEFMRPDEKAPTPLAEATAHELQSLLSEAIDQLPELQKQSLVMFTVGKLPQAQIAKVLGVSVEAVKWHVFTARRKLKEQFKEYL